MGFSLSGRVYEFVGPKASLSTSTRLGDLRPWADDECPRAHELPAPLEDLSEIFESLDDDGVDDSYFGDGRETLMVVGVQSASHDLSSLAPLWTHLSRVSGATTTTTTGRDGCDVARTEWPTMRGFAVRYVVNHRQPLDDVADFDAFAAQMHADFRDAAWASWDRLLDQHVGLWYGGPRHACHDRAALARRLLAESDLSVAERSEPDAHELYAAYAGPLAWEYQFMTCDASRPEASSECACVPSNNLADWERQSGRRTCANGTDSGPSRTREVP